MDQSFRSHLQTLDDEGELIRFTKEVDPLNNMSAIEWKAYNELGKSSLFSNIAHHPQWRACSQILADRKKWSLGLGIASNELLQTISKRLRHPIASTTVDASIAPVKEVVELSSQANLESLPSMKVSELEQTDWPRTKC